MSVTVVFLVVLSLFSAVKAQCHTPYQDCGSTEIKISSVSVPDCCSSPCVVKKGTNATVTINFTSSSNFTTMTQKVCGEFASTCINLPGNLPEFCKCATCPVVAGKETVAKVGLPIAKDYPPVTVTAKWTFYGSDDTSKPPVGCFEMPIKVE